MTKIINPILPGFNPDPSILRVGDDYYIATSTFEWWPGVQIHHSRDLVHWHLVAHPLRRTSQLNMRGNPSSTGIWAPCLTWSDGLFYLIYTDVKSWRTGMPYKDTPNYLVTATDVCGEWSEPVYLNASGFDPSLFHDDDGRKWLINLVVDHRPFKNRFGGIVIQEYDPTQQKLTGPIRTIFPGTSLGLCEGSHLYKINGWYYLMTAEGGTGFNHAVTTARSRSLFGPYEVDPENPVISSRYDARAPIQRSGHGSLVETQNGRWYIAHLCGRPLPNKGRCTLGRETAIQEVRWTEEGWLRTVSGTKATPVEVDAPGLPEHPWPEVPVRQEFVEPELDIHFATPRVPLLPPYGTTTERAGWLRLRGQHSPVSLFDQSLLARRVQHFIYRAETCLEFDPVNYQQMAGLMCVYDTDNHYYLQVTWDEEKGRVLWLQCVVNRQTTCPAAPLPLESARVYLRAVVDHDRLQFFYSMDGKDWRKYGPEQNYATLSDEQFELMGEGRFTGSFVGIACHDMSGQFLPADFDYFDYDPDPAAAGLLSQSSEY